MHNVVYAKLFQIVWNLKLFSNTQSSASGWGEQNRGLFRFPIKRERHQAGANSETDQFQAQSTLTSFAEESKRQGARQMEMTPAGVLGAFVATLCASVVGAISPAEEDYLVHASFARHTYVSDNIK